MKRCLVMVLCLLTLSACSLERVGETAVVNIVIGRQEASLPNGADAESHIRTLRVLLRQNGTVVRNEFWDFSSAGQADTRTIQLVNVPVGQTEFFFFANEASVGLSFDASGILQTSSGATVEGGSGLIDGTDGSKSVFKDGQKFFFPRNTKDNPTESLPMSGKMSVLVEQGMADLQAELQRNVIKLNLTVENNSMSNMYLDGVEFGNFFSSSMYLFPETDGLFPPSAANSFGPYGKITVGTDIASMQEYSLVVYAYPTDAGVNSGTSSPFTLTLYVDQPAATLGPHVFLPSSGVAFPSIPPNSQINILAKVGANATVDLNFEVSSWKQEIVEVPPFK